MKKQTQNKPNTNPNKPNFRKAQMTVTLFMTKDYQDQPLRRLPESKPNQTQSQDGQICNNYDAGPRNVFDRPGAKGHSVFTEAALTIGRLRRAFRFGLGSWHIRNIGLGQPLCESFLDAGILRVASEIVPLQRVLIVVVKLFGAVTIADVAPAFGPQRMIISAVRRQGRTFPFCFGILKQWQKTSAFKLLFRSKIAQIDKCRIDIEHGDRPGTTLAGPGDTGRDDHKDVMCCFFPKSKFSPVKFFSEVPAVVTPKHNDSIIGIRTSIERIDYPANAGIDKTNRCEVGLYSLAPLLVLDDLFVVSFRPGHFLAYRGDVIQVIFIDVRQSHFIQGIHIKIFGRHVPGQMRPEEAAAEEKRSIMLLTQFSDSPTRDFPVAHFTIGHVYRPPVEMGGFWDAIQRTVRRHWVIGLVLLLGWEILMPRWRVWKAAVVYFAAADCAVAVSHEVLRQGDGIPKDG